ncbi:MAG TPA: aminopeptidase, partial [Brevundimonas sp.]|nr:aminopeptidase [Brevundimonas sp.]
MIRTFGLVSALALATAMGGCAAMPGSGLSSGSDMPPLPASATAPIQYARDTHSFAQPDVARVTNVDLLLSADFEKQTLSGTAELTITGAPGATEVVLDTRDLDINSVTSRTEALEYELGAEDPILGRPLTVRFAQPMTAEDNVRRVVVGYSTRPSAAALQWLTPSQTAGGQKPYMFSQGQAILTRTWIPTQDSPGIRQTWTATIETPGDLKPVMSGEMLSREGETSRYDQQQSGRRNWRFRMTNPVPPYLIAIGVG